MEWGWEGVKVKMFSISSSAPHALLVVAMISPPKGILPSYTIFPCRRPSHLVVALDYRASPEQSQVGPTSSSQAHEVAESNRSSSPSTSHGARNLPDGLRGLFSHFPHLSPPHPLLYRSLPSISIPQRILTVCMGHDGYWPLYRNVSNGSCLGNLYYWIFHLGSGC